MDTHNTLHEHISALADGELADSERELAFAALDSAEGRAAWHAYHRIGDALREQAAGAALSSGFGARLAGRLAAEAAPHGAPDKVSDSGAPPAADTDPPHAQADAPAGVVLPLG